MNTAVTVPAVRQFTLAPENLEEAIRLCDLLSKSSIVPKDYQGNPGNILVALQWGLELGLQPLQAMQAISVINGRPCIWGDTVLALVRQSGLLELIHEDVIDGVGRCTVKRRREDSVTREFSLDDAKRAGLLGKQGPWQQYPTRMLQLRARGFALRDVFPDVLRGMYIREEIDDSESVAAPVSAATTRTAALRHQLTQQVRKQSNLNEVLRLIGEKQFEEAEISSNYLTDEEEKKIARREIQRFRNTQSPPGTQLDVTLDAVLQLIAFGKFDEATVQAQKLQNPEDKKAARRAYAAAKQVAQQSSREAPTEPPVQQAIDELLESQAEDTK